MMAFGAKSAIVLFNIKNNVLEYETTENDLHDLGSDLLSKRYIYRLFLGPKLLNKMMENYRDSMFRKRISFKSDGLEILKEKIRGKEYLQEMVYKYRRTELIELFDTSIYFFYKLIKE